MICKLCQKEHNDKVGAHLITESLIRSAIAEEGSSGRDKELMATISVQQLGKKYVGRSASLDGIKNFLGQEMADDDLLQNDNPLVDFNLVCSQCEKSFNVVETIFIQNVLPKINIIPDTLYKELNAISYNHTLLFILINIWRVAVSTKNTVRIEEVFLEKLRLQIDQLKNSNYSELSENLNTNDPNFPTIRFILYYVEDSEISKSANSVLINFNKNIKYMLINNLLIVWFISFNEHYRLPSLLTGLTSKTKIKRIINNSVYKLPITYFLGKKAQHLRTNLFNDELRNYKDYFAKVFNENHRRVFGYSAPKHSIQYFKFRINQYFKNGGELEEKAIFGEIKSILVSCYRAYAGSVHQR